jgi:hypothetical protein
MKGFKTNYIFNMATKYLHNIYNLCHGPRHVYAKSDWFRDCEIFKFLFYNCPRLPAIVGRCYQPTTVVHIYSPPFAHPICRVIFVISYRKYKFYNKLSLQISLSPEVVSTSVLRKTCTVAEVFRLSEAKIRFKISVLQRYEWSENLFSSG